MKIIVHDYSGHPFQVQLSRSLALHKHTVLHIHCTSFQTPKGNLLKNESDPANFDIIGISLKKPFEKYSFFTRYLQEREYGRLALEEIKKFNPDIIINSNIPLDPLKTITNYCQENNIKSIFWWQDVYSIAISKLLKNKFKAIGSFIGYVHTNKEISIIKKSSYVVGITSKFKDVLSDWHLSKISETKYTTIPNWAPLEEITFQPKENDWSISNNLNESFNFVYTGTLSYKHNPDIIVELAKSFSSVKNVKIVVTSEGIGADYLKEKKRSLNLNNLLILPFQEYSSYSKVLGAADVLISILEKDAGSFSVPSKVLSYLSAGKPILLAVPLNNLASSIVNQNKCGVVSDTLDDKSFIKNAWNLYQNHNARVEFGLSSRKYAENNFSIEKITNRFLSIIEKCVN